MNARKREINRATQLLAQSGALKPKPGEDSAAYFRRAVGFVRAADAALRRNKRKAKRAARRASRG